MSSPESMIGQILGPYRVVEKIGEGGMGVVYRAHDARLARDVAVKVLPAGMLSDESARRRFRKEALAISQLNHPHIATVYEFETQAGMDFIVMEYLPGESLADRVTRGPLAEKDALALGTQIASALEEAHEHGVIHRDLKPSNIRVLPKGHAKVLDFGLAKVTRQVEDDERTASSADTASTPGTLQYMAPEVLRGESGDERTDLYAFGAVLYEMATGRRAFHDRLAPRLTDSILHRMPATPQSLNPRVSDDLQRVIVKCLEKQPEHRYQSAKDVLADLRRLSAGVAPVAEKPRPHGSRRAWYQAAALVAAALLIALALNLGGLRDRIFGWRAARIESLAVLPLDDLSGDPSQEYFADGMTDELITELGKIRGLKRVISRQSVMQYKGTTKRLPQIARELDNVDGIIEGTVLREGNRVRISVQLFHGASDRQIWGQSFQRVMEDVLALQSEVAQAIAREIQVRLTPEEAATLARKRPVNPEAYDAYLRGRFHWNKRGSDSISRGMEHFRRALEFDPGYAPALAGLADAFNTLAFYSALPPAETYPKAKAAAYQALQIDPTLAEAHASLGDVLYQHDRDWPGAEREFREAIRLNPGYATGHHWYGVFLALLGRHEESVRELRRALELDPYSPVFNADLAMHYYYIGEYEKAAEHCRKTLEIHPDYPLVLMWFGRSLVQLQKFDEGIAALRRATEVQPGFWLAETLLGHAYAVAGRKQDALAVGEKLKAASAQTYIDPALFSLLYVGLGENTKSIEWGERAFEARSGLLSRMKIDPILKPLHGDPRFQALLRKMNYPP